MSALRQRADFSLLPCRACARIPLMVMAAAATMAAPKIVPLRPRTTCWKGLGADSEEKREPVSDINTALVDKSESA